MESKQTYRIFSCFFQKKPVYVPIGSYKTDETEIEPEEAVLLLSDQCGFMKLTKKFGMLHFLQPVVHCCKKNLQAYIVYEK